MARRGSIHHYFDTFVVEPQATIKKGLRVPAGKDLVVGQGATITGSVDAAQSVFLSKNVVVRGSVRAANDIIVGAYTVVEGDVKAGGDVLALDGARVRGRVVAGGRARVIGSRIDGPVEARGDVEVRGEGAALEIRAGGRVRSLPGPEEPG
ncbi:MAG: hypothetical protein HYT80_10910 [Euryarchaeota archaeon]|nr:hypothetical protein [Euryarchaeota archaeon]